MLENIQRIVVPTNSVLQNVGVQKMLNLKNLGLEIKWFGSTMLGAKTIWPNLFFVPKNNDPKICWLTNFVGAKTFAFNEIWV